jgi:hypothetical protein
MKRFSIAALLGVIYVAVASGGASCAGSSTGGMGGGSGGGSAGGGAGGGSGGPDITCSATPQAVKLADLQTSMFGVNCISCHYPAGYMGATVAGTGGAYGDYTDAMHTAGIIGKKSVYAGSQATLKIVDTGANGAALANSTLWLKLSTPNPTGWPGPHGENTNAKMPNDGSMLSAAVLQQVKDWICTGAQQ